ncbi:MAG TPA: hypothetical protein VK656_00395, partial [Candidatus Acidoferrum sp.]|nr:hypothetical protein [Candidatus Acidoferrum sp.]
GEATRLEKLYTRERLAELVASGGIAAPGTSPDHIADVATSRANKTETGPASESASELPPGA